MSAYVIVDMDVKNAEAFEPYRRDVVALMEKYGGECLARGGDFEVLEGDWQPTRLLLFRFPDRASFKAFFNDPDYQPLKALRRQVASSNLVVLDGL